MENIPQKTIETIINTDKILNVNTIESQSSSQSKPEDSRTNFSASVVKVDAPTIASQTVNSHFTYGGAVPSQGNKSDILTGAARQIATNSVSETDAYQAYQKVQNVRAISDFAKGRYYEKAAAQEYDQLKHKMLSAKAEDTSYKNWADKIEYGTQNIDSVKSTLERSNRTLDDLNDIIAGNIQMEGLISSKEVTRVLHEADNRERFLGAKTTAEKAEALRAYHTNGLQLIKEQDPSLYNKLVINGNNSADIISQADRLLKGGNLTASQANLIENFKQFGTTRNASFAGNGTKNLYSRGKYLITSKLIGDENAQAIETISMLGRVTRKSAVTAMSAGVKGTYTTQKIARSLQDKVLDTIIKNANPNSQIVKDLTGKKNILNAKRKKADAKMSYRRETLLNIRNGQKRSKHATRKKYNSQKLMSDIEILQNKAIYTESKIYGSKNKRLEEYYNRRRLRYEKKISAKTKKITKELKEKDLKLKKLEELKKKKLIESKKKAELEAKNIAKKSAKAASTNSGKVVAKNAGKGVFSVAGGVVCGWIILIFYTVVMLISLVPLLLTTLLYSSEGHETEEAVLQESVDLTNNIIRKDFHQVCQWDATIRYLKAEVLNKDGDLIENSTRMISDTNFDEIPNYEWYIMPKLGGITHIWAWEEADNTTNKPDSDEKMYTEEGLDTYKYEAEREEFYSLCDNLLPVTSIMHCRYIDYIDKDSWLTATAYMFYMFTESHDIAQYDSNCESYSEEDPATAAYMYLPEDLCARIYTENPPDWNEGTLSVIRSAELCKNVYIHSGPEGPYNGESAKEILDAKAKRSVIKDENLFGATNEIFVHEKLYDELIGHDASHYNRLGTTIWTCDPESLPRGNSETTEDGIEFQDWQCTEPIEAQFNGQEVIGLIIHQGHSNGDGSLTTWNDGYTILDSTWKGAWPDNGECHVHVDECHPIIEEYDEQGTGQWNEETEDWDVPPNHVVKRDWNVFICEHGKKYQSSGGHAPWNGKDDPGCWATALICPGHCGGHITPLISIVQNMSWEGLILNDGFKTPMFLDAEDFNVETNHIEIIEESLDEDEVVTVDAYRMYWKGIIKSWTSAWDNSPGTVIKSFTTAGIKKMARLTTSFTKVLNKAVNKLLSLIGLDTIAELREAVEGIDEESDYGIEEDEEDIFGFEGWYNEDGEINEYAVSLLSDYYGTYDDNNYEIGHELWTDFGVEFPTSSDIDFDPSEARHSLLGDLEALNINYKGILPDDFDPKKDKLTPDQIRKLLDDPTLTDDQTAIISAAMALIGKINYSMAHHGDAAKALKNGTGINSTDCSGFVQYILGTTIWDPEKTANAATGKYGIFWKSDDAAQGLGKTGLDLKPGCIVSKEGKGEEIGHVMIYIGKDENNENIVIDCNCTDGVTMRSVGDKYISAYDSVTYPWEQTQMK